MQPTLRNTTHTNERNGIQGSGTACEEGSVRLMDTERYMNFMLFADNLIINQNENELLIILSHVIEVCGICF